MHQWSSGFRHTPAKRNDGGSNPSWCSNKCRGLVEKGRPSYGWLSEFEPHARYILLCSLMGKYHLDMVERVGSLPTRATKIMGISSIGRASVLHTEGSGIVTHIPNNCSDGGMVDTLCLSRSVHVGVRVRVPLGVQMQLSYSWWLYILGTDETPVRFRVSAQKTQPAQVVEW